MNVNAAGNVLAGATQIVLLSPKTLFEPGQLIAQSQQRFSRVVHFCHLRRQPTAQPIAHRQPELEVDVGKPDAFLRVLVDLGEQILCPVSGS